MFGKFLQNLGIGKKSPSPGAGMSAEDVGAVGPGMMPTDYAAPGGYDPYDPQFGATGLADGYEYDPVQGQRKKKPKWMQAAGKMGAVGNALAKGPDVTQGMPAQQPFRLTGGLMGMGRY